MNPEACDIQEIGEAIDIFLSLYSTGETYPLNLLAV